MIYFFFLALLLFELKKKSQTNIVSDLSKKM